jgi:hypothetical protein
MAEVEGHIGDADELEEGETEGVDNKAQTLLEPAPVAALEQQQQQQHQQQQQQQQ